MKKFFQFAIGFLLTGGLAFSFVSCGKNTPSPTSPGASSGPPFFTLLTFFGKTGSTPMSLTDGVAVFGGTLWVSNNIGTLQAWTTGGSLLTTITTYSGGAMDPQNVAVGPDGYVYMSDGETGARQVAVFSPTGLFVNTFAMPQLNGDFTQGMAFTRTNAYVSNTTTDGGIFDFPITGSGSAKVFNAPTTIGLSGPGLVGQSDGLALDGAGNLYASDYTGQRIVKFNSAGIYQMAATLVDSGGPHGVAVDSEGYIYAADTTNGEVQMFNPSGSPVTQIGSGDFAYPQGVALDSAGNLYVSDFAGQVVVFRRN